MAVGSSDITAHISTTIGAEIMTDKKIEINITKERFEKAKKEMKKLLKQYKNKELDMDAVKRSYKIWTK